ncbi:methyl-accepting chemotaxis protein [Colwelliaceae bacterium 6441]
MKKTFNPLASLSLAWRLVINVCSIILLILLIISVIAIKQISADNLDKIKSGIAKTVETEAGNIKSLLITRYKVLDTAFLSPSILKWLSERATMWEDIDDQPLYAEVNAFLQRVVASEEEITSLFYSPVKTREYWDENGRIPKEIMTASIDSIPWWILTESAGKAVVNEPFEDSRTKIISTAMSKPIYGLNGEKIAIAGIDLKLETIQKEVSKNAKYNGAGTAFLFQENQALITLPENTQLEKTQPNTKFTLSSFDEVQGNSGFSQLNSNSADLAFYNVVWQGKEQLVAVKKLSLDEPLMNWRLALMYPQEQIDQPINAATQQFVITTVVLLVVIALVLTFMINLGLKPLRELGDAMSRIVSGDGDLTQRLTIKNDDEIGLVSKLFNDFVINVNSVVKDSLRVSNSVSESSANMQQMMLQADGAVQNQNAELDMIATATTELSQAVSEISSNAENSSNATSEVQKQVHEGMDLVTKADQQINTLAQSFRESEALVSDLNVSSDRIGEVLDVIGSIADQTNLLALNAAIEAARAGEHGRGFAVVADEVRTLARQTQESTSNIQKIIDSLRDNTKKVLDVMVDNRQHAEESVIHAEQIHAKLTQLTGEVEHIQQQSMEIAESTSQQSVVLEDITKNIVTTKDFSQSTSEMMNEANIAGGSLKDESEALLGNLQRFKTD